MFRSDWPRVDRCTGHGRELPSPLLWSPHLCASGWLLTQQTYLFSCLSDESQISYNIVSWQETRTSIVCFLFCCLFVTHCFHHLSLIPHHLFGLSRKTHPGCTRRPSLHSECGPQWLFDPGSHRSHVWTSVSRETWCRHPRPTHAPWCGQMSCGIR